MSSYSEGSTAITTIGFIVRILSQAMVVLPRIVPLLQTLENCTECHDNSHRSFGNDSGTCFQKQRGRHLHHSRGMIVKGWNDFKKFSLKMDMCRFAYTSYAKTLSELRTRVRGSPLKEFVAFLVKIQTIDDTVTDFTPTLPDRYHISYKLKFCYKPIQFNKKENEETKCQQKDKNDSNDTSISKSLENVNEEEV